MELVPLETERTNQLYKTVCQQDIKSNILIWSLIIVRQFKTQLTSLSDTSSHPTQGPVLRQGLHPRTQGTQLKEVHESPDTHWWSAPLKADEALGFWSRI